MEKKEYNKQYYQKNKQRIDKQNKNWRQDNLDKNRLYSKNSRNKNRIYYIWKSMVERCGKYKNYKKIRVCKKWLKYENFKKDMHNSYLIHCKKFGIKNTTIDRINNNGNYCKSNCRWATPKQQANNRRTNHYYKYNGIVKTISEWYDYYKPKMTQCCFRSRLIKLKWSMKRVLIELTPLERRKNEEVRAKTYKPTYTLLKK